MVFCATKTLNFDRNAIFLRIPTIQPLEKYPGSEIDSQPELIALIRV